MSPGTIVVAVGGNALSPPGRRATIQEQFQHTRDSLRAVVELAGQGWQVVLVHGNGPHVGHELTRNELAADFVEPNPLGVLVAATAGWIGYMIQQTLQNAIRDAGVDREVATLVTQTVVAADDPDLRRATKPIGSVLAPEVAERMRARGVPVRADREGHMRRLAPSPRPLDIVGLATVRTLLEGGTIVVAAGGGGSPVVRRADGGLEGVDAVVDKDRVAAILGGAIGADILLILTDVDAVYRRWGTPEQEPIRTMDPETARAMVDDPHVGVGSMAPKLEAAVEFAERGGGRTVIAALADGCAAIRGETGTTITGEVE